MCLFTDFKRLLDFQYERRRNVFCVSADLSRQKFREKSRVSKNESCVCVFSRTLCFMSDFTQVSFGRIHELQEVLWCASRIFICGQGSLSWILHDMKCHELHESILSVFMRHANDSSCIYEKRTAVSSVLMRNEKLSWVHSYDTQITLRVYMSWKKYFLSLSMWYADHLACVCRSHTLKIDLSVCAGGYQSSRNCLYSVIWAYWNVFAALVVLTLNHSNSSRGNITHSHWAMWQWPTLRLTASLNQIVCISGVQTYSAVTRDYGRWLRVMVERKSRPSRRPSD